MNPIEAWFGRLIESLYWGRVDGNGVEAWSFRLVYLMFLVPGLTLVILAMYHG